MVMRQTLRTLRRYVNGAISVYTWHGHIEMFMGREWARAGKGSTKKYIDIIANAFVKLTNDIDNFVFDVDTETNTH